MKLPPGNPSGKDWRKISTYLQQERRREITLMNS
jgi:hypothetical protein